MYYCDRTCQIAGWKGGHKKICGLWPSLTTIPEAAGGGNFVVATGCYKNNLIMVRGMEPGRGNCECWNYNIEANKWTQRKKLPVSTRTIHGIVVQKYMYVLVYTASKVLTLRLDLENEKSNWEERASLGEMRVDASIATDGTSYIYLSGGYSLVDARNPMVGQTTLDSVSRYSIANDKWERSWSKIPHYPRYGHSSIVANDHLYIVGGRNEEFDVGSPSSTAVPADPTQQFPICNLITKTWSLGSPVPAPTADSTTFFWGGKYIILFPMSAKCTLIYDTTRDKWSLSELHQNSTMVNQKCCVLPNGNIALLGGMDAFRPPPSWSDKVTTLEVEKIIETSKGQ